MRFLPVKSIELANLFFIDEESRGGQEFSLVVVVLIFVLAAMDGARFFKAQAAQFLFCFGFLMRNAFRTVVVLYPRRKRLSLNEKSEVISCRFAYDLQGF